MAGHSKFKNIMHRKGAQDKKRASLFAKLTREIIVATKMGDPNPAANNRLRLAIQNAKAQSMPKDNIERAIKRGSGGGDTDSYEEIRYEGYGPSGVAVIVECLSDNRNRTASDVRTIFAKRGGSLGETGSVGFMFERCGYISFMANIADKDTMFEHSIEAGAEDIQSDEEFHHIYCKGEDLHQVSRALEDVLGEANEVKLMWKALNTQAIESVDKAKSILDFIDILEELDDVQEVTTNVDITDDIMDAL